LRSQVSTLEGKLIKQASKLDEAESAILLEIQKGAVSDLNDLYEIIGRTKRLYFAEIDSDAENFAEGFRERIKNKKDAYEENIKAQKELSDKSLGYFASLLSYVLTYFDTTVDNFANEKFNIKYEKINDEKTIDLSGGEKPKSIQLRKVTFEDDKEILVNFNSRVIKNDEIKRDQSLNFIGKAKGTNFVSFAIKPIRPVPRGGMIVGRKLIKNIEYSADKDPMQDEKLKEKIKSSINKIFEEVYYPSRM